MALHWDFRMKAGTVTVKEGDREFTDNFYEGNALMIVTREFEEDGVEKYDMLWFFVGDEHAKNCLGLTKGHDNMFGKDGITRLVIYRSHCRQWKKLVDLFVRAFPKISIELLESEPKAE